MESPCEFRLMVSGSRHWPYEEWATVYDVLEKVAAKWSGPNTLLVVLHGAAMGVDSWADEWARSDPNVDEVLVFEPNYTAYGNAAPHIRNDRMLHLADYHLVAFWDGKSGGTKSVIKKAQKRDMMYEVHSPAGVYAEV